MNAFVLRTGQRRMMGWGIALVLGGSMTMLAGSLTLSGIALLFWLPYCFAVFGQSLIYPSACPWPMKAHRWPALMPWH